MSELLLMYVAGTMVMEGYDCRKCYDDMKRRRGCSKNGIPCQLPIETRFRGKVQEWTDCPTAMRTPEHASLMRVYWHWRDGKPLYPTLMEYPHRLLRQLEVLDIEVRQLELKRDKEIRDRIQRGQHHG